MAIGWLNYIDVAHDSWRNWGGEKNNSAIAKVFSEEGKGPGVKQIKATVEWMNVISLKGRGLSLSCRSKSNGLETARTSPNPASP